MEPTDPKIRRVQEFYDTDVENEWNRMDHHPVEFAVTKRVLAEYLPNPPAKILDMGGGPGKYAFELARNGYQVTLVDLSPANIDFAEQKSRELGIPLEGMVVHEAAQPLPFGYDSFDAVLLMGPLYHLTTVEQRMAAVKNAMQVLKPGGHLFASFITMAGALRSIVEGAPNQLPAEWRTMQDGLNDPALGFTEAYFARIPEIEDLMQTAGCQYKEMVGCEGFSTGLDRSFLENEINEAIWQQWVTLNLEFGRHSTALEASEHILYVACKP